MKRFDFARPTLIASRFSKEGLLLAVGLSFFYVWLICHASVFEFQNPVTILGGAIAYDALSALTNALMLFALFLLYLRKRLVPFGPYYFAFAGACLGLGYLSGLLIEVSLISDPAFSVLVVVQCLLTNMGMTCLSLEWIRLLGAIGSRSAVLVLALSSLLAAPMLVAIDAGGLLSVRILPCLFPLASLAIVAHHHESNGSLSAGKLRHYGSDSDLNIPYRLLATVFVSDFIGSMVVALAMANGVRLGMGLDAAAYLLSAILLIAAAGFWRFDFNSLIYRTAYVVMAAGCLIFALPFSELSALGIGVHQAGYRFMLLLTWLMSAWLVEKRRLSANWVFPVVTGVAFVGMFFGQEVTSLAVLALGTGNATASLSAIGTAALPIAALLLMDTRNVNSGWGFSKPISFVPSAGESFDTACAAISEEFGLTTREREVLALIAKGYTRKLISEQLGLSPETVKSYANKMYAKVGVHSRQDLIHTVNTRMEKYGGEAEVIL